MLLLMMILAAASPDGNIEIQLEVFGPSDGVTAEALLFPFSDHRASYEIEPGVLPEGDYLYDLAWSADGQTVLVANYMTANISIISPATGSVVADIPTNDLRPGAVAACANYTVTAFPFDDLVAITTETGTLLGTVATGEQPWRIEFSPDGETAYVGCDVNDQCTVIDLSTQTVTMTIENFPFWLQTYGWGSESPRNFIVFSGFTVTDDGQHIAVPNGDDSVLFINTATGAVDHTVAVTDAASVALSGDGSRLIAMSTSSDVTLHQIDLTTFSVTESVTVTGSSVGMTRDIAVNQDGSKAFISTSGNTSTLVNFTTQNFTQFSSTYSAFWTASNFDHTLAISGQYRFSVIDFASETMVAQHQGNAQNIGATSPVANIAGSIDPTRHEGVYFYSFTNSSVNYDGSVVSGSAVEGDAPRRVAISPDGNWAVVSNTLSDNASLVNLNAMATVAVLEIGDRVQNVEFTPDSRYAVICGFNSNSVKIIDTQTATVVASVPTGTRAGVVDISPDGTMACVGNISSNTVSFVELDGASSTEVAEKSCGTIGVSWAAFGVSSDVVISPDGSVCLVCASFNDNVRLFSMADYSLIATIPVGDFPLKAAFNHDGSRAMITCYMDDKVYLLEIDGASSSVLGNWASGDGPLRIAYDQVSDRFGVGLYSDKQVRFYNADDGSYLGMEDFPGPVYQPEFTSEGDLLALTGIYSPPTPSRLYRGTDYTDLPATGCTFDFCSATNTAVVAIPGPDMAFVIEYTPEGIETNPVLLTNVISVYPNPSTSNQTTFSFSLPQVTTGELAVYDLTGRKAMQIKTGDFSAGLNTNTISAHLPAGIYTVRFSSSSASITGRFAVLE
ncbi:MAG: T9SS type A sorting domain-containing protein [Candidatus Fermentibacteria bacterium]|nr:T9SS type A sorting domain-containing protein [Candidatus Fermentibacteria bacterium]